MRVTQGGITVLGEGASSGVRLTQTGTLATYGMPTTGTRATQLATHLATHHETPVLLTQSATQAAVRHDPVMQITQSGALAVVRGRVYNPRLRAWTYTLDGHDYYVLKLGDEKTLVYDLSTGQWSWFSSPDVEYWRLVTGFNWVSCGSVAHHYGSNVVVGDDTYGIIWVLNPVQGYDEDPRYVNGATPTPMPFKRRATAQITARGRTTVPCYEVYLTGSAGEPALTGQQVSLRYSDDLGKTFVNAGARTVNLADFGQEFAWRSLGLIKQPGRLFSIEDDGALARIDGLEVSDGG